MDSHQIRTIFHEMMVIKTVLWNDGELLLTHAMYDVFLCSSLRFFILFSISCASTIKASISQERFGIILLTNSETIAAARKSGISGNALTKNTITSRFVKAPSFNKIAGIPVIVPLRKCEK